VGNPTADEVRLFCKNYNTLRKNFLRKRRLHPNKPIIALLAGSRKQEIKDNLPAMIEAASKFADSYQIVLACAPSVEDAFYDEVMQRAKEKGIKTSVVRRVKNATYPLLFHSTVALVTSGTATLETALFDVPQVVCYKVPMPRIARFAFNHIIKVKYISLVNLICNREVVKELFAERFTVDTITKELKKILPGRDERDEMLKSYAELRQRLGHTIAPDNAALLMVKLLKERQASRATH
jgi:lipid-A-disaccharide synthase